MINILNKCVEQLDMLPLRSYDDDLVAGVFSQARPQYLLVTAIVKGLAATKCGSVERRVLFGAFYSSLPMYVVVEMMADSRDCAEDDN